MARAGPRRYTSADARLHSRTPIALQLGPLPSTGTGSATRSASRPPTSSWSRLARRAGEDAEILGNGMIIVAIAALIGGRRTTSSTSGSSTRTTRSRSSCRRTPGLGVYGGIITGTIAAFLYARYKRVPFLRWADIIAPGLFVMQAIARWGNFFNQELYGRRRRCRGGSRSTAPTGSRTYPCATFPLETTRFHPLFLYESLSGRARRCSS